MPASLTGNRPERIANPATCTRLPTTIGDGGPPVWRSMVAVCLRRHSQLTGWEAGFVESLARTRRRNISAQQFDVLMRILRKAGASGDGRAP